MRRLLPLTTAIAFRPLGLRRRRRARRREPSSTEPEANVVELRGDEYAFVMPETIEGGWTSIRFTNTGDEPHEFALAKLTQGKTIEDVMRLLRSEPQRRGRLPSGSRSARACRHSTAARPQR